MKNATQNNLFGNIDGLNRKPRAVMTSGRWRLVVTILLIVVVCGVASQAQRTTTYIAPKYVPPAPAPVPQYHAAPQAPAAQPQYHPAPAQPAAQPQYHPAPAQPAAQPRYNPPAQSAPQRRNDSTQQRQAPARASVKQQAEQKKEQAHEQKQQQERQKQQARQQQEQQKQEQKQAQIKQKEEARQQKEQQKRQQEQQKEQARQQKEQQKQLQKQQQEQARQQQKEEKQTATDSRTSVPKSVGSSTGRSNNSTARVLPASQSKATIQRLNATRSGMTGINRKPLPAGEVTMHANGSMTLKANDGRQFGVRSNGTIASYRDHDRTVRFDRNGKVSALRTANLDVFHGAHGQKTVVVRRPDGTKLVSTGLHSGYVQRNVVVKGQTFVQRTTIVNQHVSTTNFVQTMHGGMVVAGFVPPVFFAPKFYGWGYYPWGAPIGFAFGWAGAPWYMGPNPYFMASPMYPGAASWLTDYAIGDTLSTAYQLQADGMFDGDGSSEYAADADMGGDDFDSDSGQQFIHADVTTPVTAEIKSDIAEQVKQELANDNAEASHQIALNYDALAASLQKPNHVFVVSSDLDVTTPEQQTCALRAGDMLTLPEAVANDSALVQLRVASSQRMDCPVGVLVSVAVPDLQEMQNSFQARVESGLGVLQHEQGRNGLPSAPADAMSAPPRPAVDGLAPTISATGAAAMLDQAREEAGEEESNAVSF